MPYGGTLRRETDNEMDGSARPDIKKAVLCIKRHEKINTIDSMHTRDISLVIFQKKEGCMREM
jgi:hypothetical protein